MRTRNVLTWKNVTDDKGKITGKKAKCRLVILGFEDWRAIHEGLQTDSPTLSKLGGKVHLQIALRKGWKTVTGDVSVAFLRGEELP